MRRAASLVLILLPVVFAGCSRTIIVTVPPRTDLAAHNNIGIIEFSGRSGTTMGRRTTQEFMQTVQSAQPAVRFLELGAREQVLKSVNASRLDPAAVKAIGTKHQVNAVIVGSIEVTRAKPSFVISGDLNSVSADASVGASLTVKLYETEGGATAWTGSRSGKWPVASLTATAGGPTSLGVSDPTEKNRRIVSDLVFAVTTDLRPAYRKERAPR